MKNVVLAAAAVVFVAAADREQLPTTATAAVTSGIQPPARVIPPATLEG